MNEGSNKYRKLQLIELDMLVNLKKICDSEGLTYFLSGGTFLGAVRHKGFIPWDDDVDVALPREDYEKFLEIAEKKLPDNMELKTYYNDSNYHRPVARIINNDVQVKNHSFSDSRIEPAWIDIFPLDGMPSGKISRNIHKTHLLFRKIMIGWANYKDLQDEKPNRPIYEKMLIFIGTKFKPGRLMNLTTQYKKMDAVLKKYSGEETKVYMNFHGVYRFNSIMSVDKYYNGGAQYLFEGISFNAPENYDAYLSKIYGEYMKLPSVEKRNTHCTEVI